LILVAGALWLLGCGADPMEALSQQIKSPDPAKRKAAVIDLANLSDPRALKALADALESDEAIYDQAAVALVKKGREDLTQPKENPVVKAVADVLKSDLVAPNFRARAAWVLGEIDDRRAIPDLKGATGGPESIGPEATHALQKLGYLATGRALELWPDMHTGPLSTFPPVPPLAKKV
jgi:HEAT repeat protein